MDLGPICQKKRGYHVHLLKNKRIMKAFQRSNFVFYDESHKKITDLSKYAALIYSNEITWRVQKKQPQWQKNQMDAQSRKSTTLPSLYYHFHCFVLNQA